MPRRQCKRSTHHAQRLRALKLVLARVQQDLAECHGLVAACRGGELGQLLGQLHAQVCIHRAVRGLLHSVLKHQRDGVAQHVGGGDDLQQLLQQTLKLLWRQLVQDALDGAQGLPDRVWWEIRGVRSAECLVQASAAGGVE